MRARTPKKRLIAKQVFPATRPVLIYSFKEQWGQLYSIRTFKRRVRADGEDIDVVAVIVREK